MKADYKNWLPIGLIIGVWVANVVLAVLFVIFGIQGIWVTPLWKTILAWGLGICLILGVLYGIWSICAFNIFSYNGKRKLSKCVVEGIASEPILPDKGKGLDVGCGSGALTIACAKAHPGVQMTGIDPWGAEYATFTKKRCEDNAKAEGVKNVKFQNGNAVKLDFPDGTFDMVVSNYVYHNITLKNKQELLLETLRVLKPGGSFAIHDIMTKSRYGDMKKFVSKLKKMGYRDVRLVDTTDGKFMSKTESTLLMLTGSTLLVGRK